MKNFDGAQARHDANNEPREVPRCAPGEHYYYMGSQSLADGQEIDCHSCDSTVVVSLVEIQ